MYYSTESNVKVVAENEISSGTEESGSHIQVDFEGFEETEKPEVITHVIKKNKVHFII